MTKKKRMAEKHAPRIEQAVRGILEFQLPDFYTQTQQNELKLASAVRRMTQHVNEMLELRMSREYARILDDPEREGQLYGAEKRAMEMVDIAEAVHAELEARLNGQQPATDDV